MKYFHRVSVQTVCFTVLVLTSPMVTAQIPTEFTNLKVLDPNVKQEQLVSVMGEWATSLGVRCNYCHVGPDDLVGMDFASDEKATKRTARKMVVMVRRLNRNLLADLPTVEQGVRHQSVACYSCHRGEGKPPQRIDVVLGEAMAAKGIDAALDEYRALRAEHYGGGSYDFSSRTIFVIAQGVLQRGTQEDAKKVLAMGLEFDPESALLHAGLSMVELVGGHNDAARASAQRALEIDPGNEMAKQILSRLNSGGNN